MNKKVFEAFISRLNQITPKQKSYILIGCVILIFVMDIFVFMRPQFKALSRTNERIKSLSEQMKTLKDNSQRLGQFKEEAQQLKTKVSQESGRILSKESVPLILEKLSRMANDNGIKIDSIKPLTDMEKSIIKKKDQDYLALPIQLKAKSGYHNLGKFLSQAEQGEIFFRVKEFTMTAAPELKLHNIELTLEAVVYEEISKP